MSVRIGRNDPCTCGSGKKYKHCCALKGDRLSVVNWLWLTVIALMLLTGAIFALTSLG
jgi:hypothetical protein